MTVDELDARAATEAAKAPPLPSKAREVIQTLMGPVIAQARQHGKTRRKAAA